MRRLLLFVALLTLVGLSTAFAASFDVSSEDITTFSTDVSITVPTTEPPAATPFPSMLYVRGPDTAAMGSIELIEPTANDHVQQKTLVLSPESVLVQSTATKYFTWSTASAPPEGWLLTGHVTLYISQQHAGANRMTAALLSCPAAAPAASVTAPISETSCTAIAQVIGGVGASSNGNEERSADFGQIGPVTIAPGDQLRIKIVNQTGPSSGDWDLTWGFLPARQSRLEIT